jgi:hypothetical protein
MRTLLRKLGVEGGDYEPIYTDEGRGMVGNGMEAVPGDRFVTE